MRIVFLGSADFGLPALQMLLGQHDVAGVVSSPPRPGGRGLKLKDSPVATFCRDQSVGPVFLPESFDDPAFIQSLQACAADCFVVVAFKLLPRSIFSIPRLGTINIHASLLPAYRGPAPIQRAIEAGETKTGVTVFRIDEGIDTGEIVGQQELIIGSEETTPELYDRLSGAGAILLQKVLTDYTNGTARSTVQNRVAVSKAPKLRKSEGRIAWDASATTIFNKIRAFKPFPGTYTTLQGKKLEIEWAEVVAHKDDRVTPGRVCSVKDNLFEVSTGDGILRVMMVKPEGRKSMQVREFLCGTELQEGYVFS